MNTRLQNVPRLVIAAGIALACAAPLHAQTAAPAQGAPAQTAPPATPPQPSPPQAGAAPVEPSLALKVELEPKAIDLLKAMSARLAAAKSMSFTAITTYESPARTGLPLVYLTTSDVLMQRPDKLRVISPGDGPPTEFYYDGKVAMAFDPDKNLVAVAEAPPTIDAMLKAAYDNAAIYFPFSDFLVADPYGAVADELKLAFVVGQSRVIGNTTTDIVVIADDTTQAQIWIGADDHLPRMMRAIFLNDPNHFRHLVAFTNWQIDPAIPPGAFGSDRARAATHMQFARPDAPLPGPASAPSGTPAGTPTPSTTQSGSKP